MTAPRTNAGKRRYATACRGSASSLKDVEARATFTPYLQVLNVYNQRSVLFYFFNYDKSPDAVGNQHVPRAPQHRRGGELLSSPRSYAGCPRVPIRVYARITMFTSTCGQAFMGRLYCRLTLRPLC